METDALDVDVDARSVARDGDDGTSDARVAEALTRVTTVTTSTREGDAETRARAVRDASQSTGSLDADVDAHRTVFSNVSLRTLERDGRGIPREGRKSARWD